MTKPTVPSGFSFTSLISDINRYGVSLFPVILSAEFSATLLSLFNLPYL